MNLSTDQQAAYEAVVRGENVFITGPGGCGKSFLLQHLRKTLPGLSVTASTGIAAVNVGGLTIFSWAGIGLGDASVNDLTRKLLTVNGKARERIRECEVLAIDEVSMISPELFQKLDQIFRRVRDVHEPFGGIQLILFGDFLQLPPVNPRGRERFVFEVSTWKEASIRTYSLTKIFRQQDKEFAQVLNYVRYGQAEQPALNRLYARNDLTPPQDDIKPVVLHTKNIEVDGFNLQMLNQLPGGQRTYTGRTSGNPMYAKTLVNNCRTPWDLQLRVGAQVMLLSNLDVMSGLANGSLGVIAELGHNWVGVNFITPSGGTSYQRVEKWEFKIEEDGMTVASYFQIPLRLAYAITVHKTQGLTLDRVVCNLDPRNVWEAGQAYVALSRVRSLEGLYTTGLRKESIRTDARALAFYTQLNQISAELE